jgi:hypothetical protein
VKSLGALFPIQMIVILAVAASGMVAGGCGSTQLVNLWKDPFYQAGPLKKLLVVAMRKDELRRRMWEDAFVSALGEDRSGTVAIPSYQLFPDRVPDTLAVQQKTKEEGFDGVLVVARVHRDTVKTDVQGYVTVEPFPEYNYRWNTYVTYYENVYHPPYTESQAVFSVRTDLLLPQEGAKLVWSGTSKGIDPSSPDQFRKSVADLVMDRLSKAHLVR